MRKCVIAFCVLIVMASFLVSPACATSNSYVCYVDGSSYICNSALDGHGYADWLGKSVVLELQLYGHETCAKVTFSDLRKPYSAAKFAWSSTSCYFPDLDASYSVSLTIYDDQFVLQFTSGGSYVALAYNVTVTVEDSPFTSLAVDLFWSDLLSALDLDVSSAYVLPSGELMDLGYIAVVMLGCGVVLGLIKIIVRSIKNVSSDL